MRNCFGITLSRITVKSPFMLIMRYYGAMDGLIRHLPGVTVLEYGTIN